MLKSRSLVQRIGWWLVLAVASLCVGCGDPVTGGSQAVVPPPPGGGGGGVGGSPVSGKVTLPPGFGLPMDTLKVTTAMGEVALAADGSFSTGMPDTSPTLALVVSVEGKVVLIGFLQSPTTTGELSPQSTAIALMYLAVAGFTLPADQQAAALSLLGQDTTIPNLTQAVNTSLAANPTALTDGDPTLLAALQAAQQDLIRRGQAAPRPQSPAAVLVRELTMSVQPTASQSGAKAEEHPDSPGSLKVTNSLRRLAYLHVFKTSSVDSSGTITPLNPYQHANATPIMLSSIAAMQGVITSVLGLVSFDSQGHVSLNIPFVPTTASIPASMLKLEDTDKKVSYLVLMDSPSVGNHRAPTWQTDSNFSTADREALDKEHNALMVDSFFIDIINPLLASALGAGTEFVQSDFSKILLQSQSSSVSISNVILQVTVGTIPSWQNAATSFLAILAQNPGLILTLAPKLTAAKAAQVVLTKLLKANIILGAVDLAMSSFDLFLVTSSLTSSNPSEQWQVDVRDDSVTTYKGVLSVHKHFHGERQLGADLEVIDYDADFTANLTFDKTQPGAGTVYSADLPLTSYSILGSRDLAGTVTPIRVRGYASPGHPLESHSAGTLTLNGTGGGTLELSYSFPIMFDWASIGLPPNVDAQESGNPTFTITVTGPSLQVSQNGTPGLEPFAYGGNNYGAQYSTVWNQELAPP